MTSVFPVLNYIVRIFGATFLMVVSVAAATPDEGEIRALYQRALRGDKAAVESVIAKLETKTRAEPHDQMARVTLGSAMALRSRDMSIGPAKLRTLNEGIRVMNDAVAAATTDAHVRLIRAMTLGALPFFLGHKAEARADFEWLAAHKDGLTADERRAVDEHVGKR